MEGFTLLSYIASNWSLILLKNKPLKNRFTAVPIADADDFSLINVSDYGSHLFMKVAKHAGIKDCRFHDTGHTFASWLAMKGVDLKTVQDLLGHKDFKMTLRYVYAHLSPGHRKSAVEILEEKSIILGKHMDKISHGDAEKNSNILVTLPETEKSEFAASSEPSVS